MSPRISRLGLPLVAAALLALCLPAGPLWAAPALSAAPECRSVRVPVALTDGGPATAHLDGQVCYPTTVVPSLQGAIQVLVSGTAYGPSYWDFPYQPDTYSYVRAAAGAGYTTFNFDRIGIGTSTRPASLEDTIPVNAFTIHQAIARLRAGAVDGVAYDRVVIVGHSLGSLIAWYEAATYHDVDALVESGILHTFDTAGVATFLTTLYPAALDPMFAGKVVDPGYLTTIPGSRAASFYYLPNTDPDVVATDESLKETASALEAEGVFQQELPGVLQPVTEPPCTLLTALCDAPALSLLYSITRQITVPVLDVVGQYDGLLCGGATGSNQCSDLAAVRQSESTYYTGLAKRCLTFDELPMSGHDVNLERNAQDWFTLSNEWSSFTLAHASQGDQAPCWSSSGLAGVLTH